MWQISSVLESDYTASGTGMYHLTLTYTVLSLRSIDSESVNFVYLWLFQIWEQLLFNASLDYPPALCVLAASTRW